MPLRYQLPNGKMLHISDDVLDVFHKHRYTRYSSFESGGILLGKVYSDSIMVEKVTTPGKGDKWGALFFHRDRSRAQKIVDQAFAESGGEQTYLGEWHSHSEKKPSPSFKDRYEIERAFRMSRLNVEFMICIIVGNENRLGNIWVGFFNTNGMNECALYSDLES